MTIFEIIRKRISNISFQLNNYFSTFTFSQDNYLLILGGFAGLFAGVGAIIFHELIDYIKELFIDLPGHFFGTDSLLDLNRYPDKLIIIIIPAIGGLLVGIIAHFFEKGERGEGIPNVITAVATKGGAIKGSIAIKKTIGSALSIGTGGAGGKEGPIVQIGSSIASAFGQFLHLSPDRLRILVGCGAAGGLSAAFNAPLGGALFAMEIILRTFRANTFSPIIISSVIATALSRSYLGNEPAFSIPKYELVTNSEFFFYIILGLLSGLTAVYFVKVFYSIEDLWNKYKNIPIYIKPAIGGLVVGCIGLYLPGVFGFTYVSIEGSLVNHSEMLILLLLLIFKPIATAMTIGSGGNGGTFAPSLFTGAMLGGIVGQLVNIYFPEYAAQPGAYALVGMGAVVAGTTNASLTALIMVFEMTNNYKIILPLMLTIIISTTVAKSILGGSLYTLKFKREGKEIDIYGRKVSILKNIQVKEMIEKNNDVIYEHMNFHQILETIKNAKYNTVLVKNKNNELVGEISFQDIRDGALSEETKSIANFLIAKDIMTKNYIFVQDYDDCDRALKKMESGDYDFIPVLGTKDERLLGVVSRQSLVNRYQKELFILQSKDELE